MSDIGDRIAKISPLKLALMAQGMHSQRALLNAEPIAIIGMSCRFPGADNLEEFWRVLRDGVDAITETPSDRWDVDALYDANPEAPGKMTTRWGGFLPQIDRFDSSFFGISPREAMLMDPQQRLLLEVAWEALEHAGQTPRDSSGDLTGVFVGICGSDYGRMLTASGCTDAYVSTGNNSSVAAGRLSYLFGLQGPCMAIDTACSASLVSVHLACQSLRNEECHVALAGGVNVILSPEATVMYSRARMMASDGRCKTFDAAADGYVRGEGCGMLVMKRLSDAVADGDRVLALIRGSAVNQDGRSNGLTAPNGPAQEAVIRRALADGGVSADDLGYIEAHGTGTSLGDPIEVQALGRVLGRDRREALPIGSVKTNVGHLEGAAGVAGLIKVVLAMRHEEIPPHLHLKKRNPYIAWDEIPVCIPTESLAWLHGERRRFAGVSSFGFSGTNAHVVLEEAPLREVPATARERPLHVLTVSAKTDTAMKELAGRYGSRLRGAASLADVAYTANVGRSPLECRLAAVSKSPEEMRTQLEAFVSGRAATGLISGYVQCSSRPKVAFLFSGQGSQYAGMGRRLFETEPAFQQTLERCDELLRGTLKAPLLEVLYPEPGATSPIDETAYTQPALFALEYALAELWRKWGVEPAVVLGHSVGEYVAACVAGMFSLEEGLRIIAERGRRMQDLPAGGCMVNVSADEARVARAIAPYRDRVSIAAVNGTEAVVISGASEAVAEIVERFRREGIATQPLRVSHAFHSPEMEPMLDAWERSLSSVGMKAPSIGLVSNLTGKVSKAGEVTTPGYWRRHARETVRFSEGIRALREQGVEVFVEIGPTPVLLGLARKCGGDGEAVWAPSLRQGRDDWQQMLESVAQIYVHGVELDWEGFDREYTRRKVTLPSYPFQRERYWMEAAGPKANGDFRDRGHVLLGRRLPSAMKDVLFESQVSTGSPAYLNDHRIFGTAVFPATAYLEMAMGASHDVFGPGAHIVEDFIIQEALILPRNNGSAHVQFILSPAESGSALFQIFSLDEARQEKPAPWKLHATGRVRPMPMGLAEMAPGFAGEPDTSGLKEIPAEVHYASLRNLGLEYGASFRVIERLWRGDGEAWGHISIANPGEMDLESHRLHPVLMDGCLQVVMAALPAGIREEVYLPIGVESFSLFKTAISEVWCHCLAQGAAGTGHETLKGDLRLFDRSGQLVAELKGFTGKRAARRTLLAGAQVQIRDSLYRVDWRPKESEYVEEQEETCNWLVLADRSGAGGLLAAHLAKHGQICQEVFAASGDSRGEVELRLDPADPESVLALLLEMQNGKTPLRGVVHTWGLDVTPTDDSTATEVMNAQAVIVQSILHLVQAMTKLPQPPRLVLVTRGGQAAGRGTENVSAPQATLWGLGQVINTEHPELRFLTLDLDPAAGIAESIQPLFEELFAAVHEPQVAFRSGVRLVPRLARYTAPATVKPTTTFRAHATYLITGGLGALGLQTARWLIANGARHLVLANRSAAPDSAREILAALASGGARIECVRADVSREEDATALFSRIANSMPPLRGVIHAAGVLDDGPLVRQSWGRFANVLAPKVMGAWNLHQLTKHMDLDLFVLFSSVAALIGSRSQGSYAAANSFLDVLSHHRRALGLRALSINWGLWAGAGMAASLSEAERDRRARSGIGLIDPEQGLETLKQLLQQESAQLAFLPIDWGQALQSRASGVDLALFSDLVDEERRRLQDAGFRAKPLELLHQLEAAPAAKRRQLLSAYIRDQVNDILKFDSSHALEPSQGFFQIGMDSLMAVELQHRLQSALGVTLSSTVSFDQPNIESLARYLLEKVLFSKLPAGADEVSTPPDAGAPSEDIHALSEEELMRLLARELDGENLVKSDRERQVVS